MPHPYPCTFLLVAFLAGAVQAQTLNELNPVQKMLDVTQFGVPRDAHYIFCNGDDCPDRSIKHLYVPPPPAPPRGVEPAPQTMPIPNLSRAKDAEPTPAPAPVQKKQKPKRKKPAVKWDCKPVPLDAEGQQNRPASPGRSGKPVPERKRSSSN